MYKVSEFAKPLYKIGEVAKLLGVTTRTIQNYDNQGKIETVRSDGGYRLVTREGLIKHLSRRGLIIDDTSSVKKDVIYARVSSHEQKVKGDLDRQAMKIVDSVHDLQNLLILKEVGSGLNDKRKQLLKLIDLVLQDEVNRVFVTYRDRLTRFGYHYLEKIFLAKGVSIIVLNDEINDKNVQEELVEDMMSLIASFSGKLYGMRSHKKTWK